MLVFLWLGIFWIWATKVVQADTTVLRIRAVYPNPPGADTYEWVAVENVSGQNFIAAGQNIVLRDVKGSVTQFPWIVDLAVGEVKLVSATQSGIVLNNDQDQVELLQNGVKFDASALYLSPAEGKVWLQGSDGQWKWVDESDFWNRLATKNWAWPTPAPSPTLASSPNSSNSGSIQYVSSDLIRFSPCTSPEWIELSSTESGVLSEVRVEDDSGSITNQANVVVSAGQPYQLSWSAARLSNSGEVFTVWIAGSPQSVIFPACLGNEPFVFVNGSWTQAPLTQNATTMEVTVAPATIASKSGGEVESLPESIFSPVSLGTSAGVFVQPLYPQYDFFEEKQTFQRWKERALVGSGLLIFGGSFWIAYGFPWCWRWYKDRYG